MLKTHLGINMGRGGGELKLARGGEVGSLE